LDEGQVMRGGERMKKNQMISPVRIIRAEEGKYKKKKNNNKE